MEDCGDNNIAPTVANPKTADTEGIRTSLLVKKSASWWSRYVLRYRNTRKCVSSKAALLILSWSFMTGLWYGLALNPDVYLRNFLSGYSLIGYGITGIVLCFFPLAGYLADVKYGRYKIIIRSLFIELISLPSLILLSLCGVGLFLMAHYKDFDSIIEVTLIVAASIAIFLSVIVFIFSYVGLAGFMANVIQFGVDQLHDSPGEDRTLFIHWYL